MGGKWLNKGYPVEVDGVAVREYQVWYGVKNRKNYNSTYDNVAVCKEWEDYGNFYEWVTSQKGWYAKDVNGRSFTIDKDIKSYITGDPKIYSPETCIIIPNKINNYFHLNRKLQSNRELPFGVMKSKVYPNKYNSAFDYHNKARHKSCVEEAQELYLKQKKQGLFDLVDLYRSDLEETTVELLVSFDFYKYFKESGCNMVV